MRVSFGENLAQRMGGSGTCLASSVSLIFPEDPWGDPAEAGRQISLTVWLRALPHSLDTVSDRATFEPWFSDSRPCGLLFLMS